MTVMMIALLKMVHMLSAGVWVGGMFLTYVVLRPSLGVLEPAQRLLLHGQVLRRFFLVVWHAMPLVILSGYGMIALYGGMAGVRWPIHAMMLVGLIMGAVYLWIFFGPYRVFRGSSEPPVMVASLDAIRKLVGLNLLLGLLAIVLAFVPA